MADRPALRGVDADLGRAQRVGLAHHELPLRLQVAHRQRPAQLVQRMTRMGGEEHAQAHQVHSGEALGNDGGDGEVCTPLQ